MVTAERVPAEVFPPGEFVQDELDARGWSQSDLAEIMGRDANLISALVTGKRSISPETARGLGAAFGTSAELWMNLEAAFQLSKVEHNDFVSRRARLYSLAPIQQMVRRGWLSLAESDGVDRLEQEFLRFYRLKTLERKPEFEAWAARKSSPYNETSDEELAWVQRAWHMAQLIDSPRLTDQRLNQALEKLRDMRQSPEELRRVPSVLREAGVRFVVVENLPKTKIDGACFWLNKTAPVVALSLRFDRIDWFWHTLMHELAHVERRDKAVVDSEIDKAEEDDRPKEEKAADEMAASFLIPPAELTDFALRVHPFFSKKKIRGFAGRIGVHPGLVVGQLQHKKYIGYAHNREMLVKVREIVASTALTDGWGDVAPA